MEVIRTGKPSRTIFTNYEPVGSRWFQLDRYPYFDADNNVIGAIIVEVEITDRIQIEDRLKQLLEQERDLRDQLEMQNQQRVEFTRTLVHELKTPLTPLLMASEILAEQQKDEDLRKTARVVYNGALALNKRIDELLDLAKGEIGMLKLHYSRHDPVEIIREVCDYMSYSFESKNQEFIVDIPEKMPLIDMDDERIGQVLINILDNCL